MRMKGGMPLNLRISFFQYPSIRIITSCAKSSAGAFTEKAAKSRKASQRNDVSARLKAFAPLRKLPNEFGLGILMM